MAQISYPDRKEAAPTGFAGLVASVQNLFRGEAGEEEASLSQQITPTRLRTQVVYEEVYPGVDFQYELYSYHIKETILVKEPLSSGYAFSFRLKLQRLTPELLEDGSVALNKETGERVYWIPGPLHGGWTGRLFRGSGIPPDPGRGGELDSDGDGRPDLDGGGGPGLPGSD